MGLVALLFSLGSQARQSVWGDGFIEDHPLARWRAPRWDEIDLDELVLFDPALGPAARANRAGGFLGDHLRACREGFAISRARPPSFVARRARLLGEPRGADVSAILDDALAGRPPSGHGEPCALAAFSLASAVNAAYLFPDAEPLHETLAAASWVGVVAGGRAALLSPPLAAIMLDVLDAAERGSPRDGRIAACAARAVGMNALRRRARAALERGRPVAVTPRRVI